MSGPSNGGGVERAQLLFVDDDPHTLEILRRWFEKTGLYVVDLARGSRAALEQCRAHLPDATEVATPEPAWTLFTAAGLSSTARRAASVSSARTDWSGTGC